MAHRDLLSMTWLCAALLSACDPGVFDKLTRGSTRPDGGLDSGALDASDVDDDGGDDGVDDDGGSGVRPDAGDGGSLPPPDCEDEATICDTATMQRTCVRGRWSEPQACERACIDDACGGRCKPGERQCDDNQPQRCNDSGEWVADGSPCESICDEGACEGACAPEATQCVSSTRLQTCDENGSWGATSACPFACVGNTCGGQCVPGARQCVMETPQRAYLTCNTEGVWSAPSMCSYVCVDGGECGGECVPGARRCMNNAPLACSPSGAWVAEAACSGARPVCVGAGECRCRPGSLRCSSSQPQVCDADNVWQNVGAPCTRCTLGRCEGEGCS